MLDIIHNLPQLPLVTAWTQIYNLIVSQAESLVARAAITMMSEKGLSH